MRLILALSLMTLGCSMKTSTTSLYNQSCYDTYIITNSNATIKCLSYNEMPDGIAGYYCIKTNQTFSQYPEFNAFMMKNGILTSQVVCN